MQVVKSSLAWYVFKIQISEYLHVISDVVHTIKLELIAKNIFRSELVPHSFTYISTFFTELGKAYDGECQNGGTHFHDQPY